LIDGYSNNQAGLQFATPDVHVAEQASQVQLGGLCDQSHDGQAFNWAVTVSGSTFASGSGACAHGQFSIDFSTVSSLVCGVPYQVEVSASWGGSAQMTIDKLCEPLASTNLSNPPPNYGQPQSCQLEYRMSGDGSDQGLCQAVCFRNNILSSQEIRPLDECESLILQVSRR
jgi:hypothetical protein